jgi:leucyl-tRNA synthetase
VDTYTGGIEHATMHLIYTRFFHKACRDMGIMEGHEPMTQLRNQGIVLGEDSEKMSKSRGNVVAPDDLVKAYGADTVRAYLMFFARWKLGGPWNSSGIDGTSRWLRRVWNMVLEEGGSGSADANVIRKLRRKVHQTLRSVTLDYENFEFNTIISSLMELSNEMVKARQAGAWGSKAWDEAVEIYLKILAPVAPHVTEELWVKSGRPYSVHQQSWPMVDKEAAAEEEITLAIQIEGKVRDRVTVPVDMDENGVKELVMAREAVLKYLAGKQPQKVIYVKGRLVNIVP